MSASLITVWPGRRKFSDKGRMLGQKLIIRFESVRNTLGNTKGLCGAKI
jgi:hypothetical protein